MDYKKELERLLALVNGVTSYYRHGQEIPEERLRKLSDVQIDLEEKMGLI